MKNSLVAVSMLALLVNSCNAVSPSAASNSNLESSQKVSSSFKVDEVKLNKAMDILEKTAVASTTQATASFSSVKVEGDGLKEMLTDYAKKSRNHDMSEVKILLKMQKSDIPEADDGSDVVGLARNIDVGGYAVDLYRNENNIQILNQLEKTAIDALFEVTSAGGFVGIESNGWTVCGTSIPSLIIVNPVKKLIHSLSPDNTEC